MRFLKLLVLLGLIISGSQFAQVTVHRMVHTGFTYQNMGFGEVGGRLLFLTTDDVLFRVGAGALVGYSQDKVKAMPKLQGDVLFNFRRGVDVYHSHYFLTGVEATTKYLAPKVGVSVLGLIDLTAGYGFPLGSQEQGQKKFQGLNLNFTLNVPIVLIKDLL
ncbi:hypothetical protein [Planobacterium oryzisoli]|uniref:Outer membrane protein beta-barrel domain-containing protein n=1 Tax=Planobacterium oryzisoli TaxID=2771435 RepID=A0A930YWT7_9FLAO|nr:hypothetical protein [Planobacterium oryzisoli]MBF5027884.1 hypothetical protein [Planobacterium oryzisoli]